ncbi:hypothetical protein VVT58_20875 (plasmid) [Sphingobium sp. SJ10-10]|uniref:Uncharacterized protein n=1 Tax=Sphingobium fuliginis (strain ATCC 27551) TaxID=336203 RepID=A0A292ZP74_SPHSA|nr:hypothetical protein [Sphingobium abikonense]MEC6701495.1 hypothetical protein [Sphingobium sp. SJ10-10]GAY24709.1 hypothetical protein SFOMI_5294 [Sphingobium fuliginis]
MIAGANAQFVFAYGEVKANAEAIAQLGGFVTDVFDNDRTFDVGGQDDHGMILNTGNAGTASPGVDSPGGV